MNVAGYLNRIAFSEEPSVSQESLIALHKAHVFHVPFENLDIINKIPIVLEKDRFCDKIIEKKRGGICYELNGAFQQLLDSIGFNSHFISCNVFVPAIDDFGPDFGHIAMIIILEDAQYLVDVGFGDAFIEPLKLEYEIPQKQYGVNYRLRKLEEGEVLLEKSADGMQYQRMYKFNPAPKQLEEFTELCDFHQHAPRAPFNKQALCSLPTLDGRITLTANSLNIRSEKGKEEIAVASVSEFNDLLAKHFKILVRS